MSSYAKHGDKAMARRALSKAGYVLLGEIAVGVAAMFALDQLGYRLADEIFMCVLAVNLIAAWFLAKAARAQGRSALLYGLCSVIPAGALWAFWKLRDSQLYAD